MKQFNKVANCWGVLSHLQCGSAVLCMFMKAVLMEYIVHSALLDLIYCWYVLFSIVQCFAETDSNLYITHVLLSSKDWESDAARNHVLMINFVYRRLAMIFTKLVFVLSGKRVHKVKEISTSEYLYQFQYKLGRCNCHQLYRLWDVRDIFHFSIANTHDIPNCKLGLCFARLLWANVSSEG